MKPVAALLPLILLTASAPAEPLPVPTGEFTRLQLTDEFWAEGIAAGDFNRDGKQDVAYGP